MSAKHDMKGEHTSLCMSFPLTPALSLGERENGIQPHSTISDWICAAFIRETASVRSLFPLPEGEGQGEGKRNVLFI
jgi:hypothetical protein